jgi:hypothetical protein
MRIILLLVLLGILMGSAFSTVKAESGEEKMAASAAQAWLSLIDNGDYSRSWKEASAYFQGAISEKGWEASLGGVRKPLGKLVSRNVKTTKYFAELPGAPDGQYVVVEFQTSFENKKSAIETVTFVLGKGGQWRAMGYHIK